MTHAGKAERKPGRPAERRGWVLIGARGSGKTTVGRALAAKTGMPFVDTDDWIVRREGCSIRDIFTRVGEAGFRRIESEIIFGLPASPPAIVAVGGGAVEDPRNVTRLRELGRLVWLDAPAEILHVRIMADVNSGANRPALTHLPQMHEVIEVLRRRVPLYEAACDLRIDAALLSPENLAERILAAASSLDDG